MKSHTLHTLTSLLLRSFSGIVYGIATYKHIGIEMSYIKVISISLRHSLCQSIYYYIALLFLSSFALVFSLTLPPPLLVFLLLALYLSCDQCIFLVSLSISYLFTCVQSLPFLRTPLRNICSQLSNFFFCSPYALSKNGAEKRSKEGTKLHT